ncbi:MAG: NAD(P)/FAD-dependent oxidoreductase [Hyphomicrobium sp.]|nr:NAD(P)/FAD-dependent oxidoreductase [Hyphomicrobium sp.]
MADVETVVVGGGVIGLAIAAAAAASGQQVLLLERNSAIGREVSSRSSEVIHAGLYYPPNSNKAKFCVSGRHRLYKFAQDNGVPCKKVGKLVVATTEAELTTLQRIAEGARANGVEDLHFLEPSDVKEMEPELSCVAALLSPSSGIIDSHSLMLALEGHLTASGGMVALNSTVERVDVLSDGEFEVRVNAGEACTIKARNIYFAAGLGMSDLSDQLPKKNGYEPPRLSYAKGHYFSLIGPAPFQRLVYPVPVEGGLGTHLTLDLQGRGRFGPDVKWIDSIDYAFEDADGQLCAQFEQSIRRYWPSLPSGALQPAYTGIRPKIYRKGEAPRDFEIHGPKQHGIPGLVALYGIESPGLTSCLAIADHCLRIGRDA